MKKIVLALSAAVLFSGSALAGDVVRQKPVSFADLNLSSEQDLAKLHARLAAAADEVCADTKDTTVAPFYEDCRKQAIKSAIAKVGENVSKRIALVR